MVFDREDYSFGPSRRALSSTKERRTPLLVESFVHVGEGRGYSGISYNCLGKLPGGKLVVGMDG